MSYYMTHWLGGGAVRVKTTSSSSPTSCTSRASPSSTMPSGRNEGAARHTSGLSDADTIRPTAPSCGGSDIPLPTPEKDPNITCPALIPPAFEANMTVPGLGSFPNTEYVTPGGCLGGKTVVWMAKAEPRSEICIPWPRQAGKCVVPSPPAPAIRVTTEKGSGSSLPPWVAIIVTLGSWQWKLTMFRRVSPPETHNYTFIPF